MRSLVQYLLILSFLAVLVPAKSEARVTLVCDGASLVQQDASKWYFYITNSYTGEEAKHLIYQSAEKEAYFAAQDRKSGGWERWPDRSFWWMNQRDTQPGEYKFVVYTPYGWDVIGVRDLTDGRRPMVTEDPGNNPFRAIVRVIDGGTRLRFTLYTKRGMTTTRGGTPVSCSMFTLGAPECLVQEYIFNGCQLR